MADELGIAVLELQTDMKPLEAGMDRAEAYFARKIASMQAIADSLHLDLNVHAQDLDAAAARLETAAARGGSGGGLVAPGQASSSSPGLGGGMAGLWGSRGSGQAGSTRNPIVVAVEAGKFTGLGPYGADSTQANTPGGGQGSNTNAIADSANIAALKDQISRFNGAISQLGAMNGNGPGWGSGATPGPSASPTTIYNYSYRYDTGPTGASTGSSGSGKGGGGKPPPIAFGASPGGFDMGGGGGGNKRVDIFYHRDPGTGSASRTTYNPVSGLRSTGDTNNPFSAANLFKGDEGRGGALGLPGFGSVGSLAGLGLEHWLLTGLGIGASAGSAVTGAGVLGLSGLSSMVVGGGSDALISHDTLTQAKAMYTEVQALNKAIAVYGKGSKQAAAAQYDLNQTWKSLGGGEGKQAVENLDKNAEAVKSLFDKDAGPARVQAAHVFDQILTLASSYTPLITSAADKNLKIVNSSLRPLFSWLEGPEGVGVFNTLEDKFRSDLPTSIHAFDGGLEDFLRLMQAASKYTGGLSKDIDNFFTGKNKESTAQYDEEVKKLVGDVKEWSTLLKLLAEDADGLFRQDSGTANSIIKEITGMLQKLHEWENSTAGETKLQNIFYVHKQEIDELLQLLPALVKGYGSFYLDVAPPLVKALTGIAKAFDAIASAIEKIPGGADFLGGLIVAQKLGLLGGGLKLLSGGGGLAGGAAAGAAGVAGRGAETELAEGALGAGLVSGRGGVLRSLVGKLLGGDALASGVETATVGAAGAVEGAGAGGLASLMVGGGAALAPLIGTIIPIVGAGMAAYGGYKLFSAIFKGTPVTTSRTPDDLTHLLQQHGTGALGALATPGAKPVMSFIGGGRAGGRIETTQPSTVGQIAPTKAAQSTLETYLNNADSSSVLSKLGYAGLQNMVKEGKALQQIFKGNADDVSLIDRAIAKTQGVLAPLDNALALMVRRWKADANDSLPGLVNTFAANTQLIASTLSLSSSEGEKAMHNNVQKMVQDLTKGMADGKISVKSGMQEIQAALQAGMKNGATSWQQSSADMLSTLDTLRDHGKISAQQYSDGVNGVMVTGAQHVRSDVLAQYSKMESQVKTAYANGNDGLVQSEAGLQKQLQGLHAKALSAAASAEVVWLTNLEQSLKAAGKLTEAEMGAIDSAIGKEAAAGASTTSVAYSNASSRLRGPGGASVGRATGGMVNQPMVMVGEEAPTHPEYVLATNPAYRDKNLDLWAQAGSALGVQGFAGGGMIGHNTNMPGGGAPGAPSLSLLKSLGKRDTGTIAGLTDAQVIQWAINTIQAKIGGTGSGGQASALMSQLGFYQSMISGVDPLYGQDAASYIVTSDPNTGATVTPYIDQAAVNLSMGEYQHEMSAFLNPALNDVTGAQPYVRALMPALKTAIGYRQGEMKSQVAAQKTEMKTQVAAQKAEMTKKVDAIKAQRKVVEGRVKAAQARIRANLKQIAQLQGQINSKQTQINTEMGKKKPDYKKISSLKNDIQKLQTQISTVEAENRSLGGDETDVGTGGQIGALNNQISGYDTQVTKIENAEQKAVAKIEADEQKKVTAIQGKFGKEISGYRSTYSNMSGYGASVFAPKTTASVFGNDTLQAQEVLNYIGGLSNPNLQTALTLAVNGAAASSTGTSAIDQTLISDQSQKISQLESAAAIQAAQAPVLASIPAFGGFFAKGGVVPGALGEPRTIIAHGGEVVKTPAQAASEAHVTVHVQTHGGAEQFVRTQIEHHDRKTAKTVKRAMPGRGGGQFAARPYSRS